QRRELGVGEVEGDADDRLPVGAGPFVAEVAGRVEAAEPLPRKLAVELGDVLLEHRPLELQAEVLDLHLEETPRLRRRLLERVHGGHGTGFEHVIALAAPCVPSKRPSAPQKCAAKAALVSSPGSGGTGRWAIRRRA